MGVFLIWSIEHGAWWRPARYGYTTNIAEAGIYDQAEAERIVRKANYPPGTFHECAIPEECVRPMVGAIEEG